MPSGKPPTNFIVERKVTGFALDTNVIRSAGYRFEAAPLSLLSRQLPPWMRMLMPEVVVSEVVRQQSEAVQTHVNTAATALKAIGRVGLDVSGVESALQHSAAVTNANGSFQRRIEAFVKRHQGSILKMGPRLADDLFSLYFSGSPPFGDSKARKHEFPDAAALLTLEASAKRLKTMVIAVSEDKAWSEFAEESTWPPASE